MRTSRTLLAAAFCGAAALAPTVSGCGSDGNGGTGPSPALYASWNATSFMALGTDFIANGMSLILTLDPAGTYTLDITNDLIDACDPGPDCVNGGSFSGTATQVKIDPGTQDEVVFNYSIAGTTLTLTGSIDGNAATITLERL